MSFYCDDVDTALGGLHTSAYTGLGLPGADVPATGTDGPSVLYPCITMPNDAAVEVFAQLTRLPGGTLNFAEDGSFDYTGSTDYFEFRLWVDGVASTTDIGYGAGIVRVSLAVGASSGFTAGATLGGVRAGGTLGPNASAFGAGAVLASVRAGGSLRGLAPAAENPAGYYRRNARDILGGRRRGDGADVMLKIGARRRR